MTTITGLVLAGGLSRRMGENKLLLPFGPERLIDRVAARLAAQCASVLVNINAPIDGLARYTIVPDDIPGHQGPLAGLAAGLAIAREKHPDATHVLSVAADTPFFPQDLSARLAGDGWSQNEISVASDEEGRWHPTFALWPIGIEADLRSYLGDPANRRVRAFIERHPHRSIAFPLIQHAGRSIEPFFNINTPEDYRQALQFLDDRP